MIVIEVGSWYTYDFVSPVAGPSQFFDTEEAAPLIVGRRWLESNDPIFHAARGAVPADQSEVRAHGGAEFKFRSAGVIRQTDGDFHEHADDGSAW